MPSREESQPRPRNGRLTGLENKHLASSAAGREPEGRSLPCARGFAAALRGALQERPGEGAQGRPGCQAGPLVSWAAWASPQPPCHHLVSGLLWKLSRRMQAQLLTVIPRARWFSPPPAGVTPQGTLVFFLFLVVGFFAACQSRLSCGDEPWGQQPCLLLGRVKGYLLLLLDTQTTDVAELPKSRARDKGLGVGVYIGGDLAVGRGVGWTGGTTGYEQVSGLLTA